MAQEKKNKSNWLETSKTAQSGEIQWTVFEYDICWKNEEKLNWQRCGFSEDY